MKRPRTAWFCFEFVALLCAFAFLAGLAVGIIVTLHTVTKTAPPPMRAEVVLREREPRVTTHTDETLSF